MKIYQDKISQHRQLLKHFKKRDRLMSALRLSLVGISFFFIYLGLSRESWDWFGWAALAFGLFLLMLFLHQQIRLNVKRQRELLKINEEELGFLKGDLSPFSDGSNFLNRDHFFSFDLDIFGSHSLFHHLNRSATLKGKHRLAQWLSKQPAAAEIIDRQQGVQELASDLSFRQQFMLEARLLEEDPALDRKLAVWQKDDTTVSPLLNPWLLYSLSFLTLGALVYWIVLPSVGHFYVFGGLFSLNLLLLWSQGGKLLKEQKHLNGLANSILIYSRLLKLIEERSAKGERLAETISPQSGGLRASQALYRFSRICDAMDQMANLAAIFINGLFLYHLHTLRKLILWKQQHASSVGHWLEVVAEWDALSSLGNFAYNNATYIYPTLADQPVYRASELGHPLIASSKRVNNSIDFGQQPYIVLTGSNMSGKSTFLKTLGVNLVLASAGAPVCAGEMTFYPFTILSSMKMVDSIEKGESYFQAEVLRLKRLVAVLETGEPAFVLLDEILRGTNSDDKRNGTRLFLQKITGYNAYGVMATHDIDIADLAQADGASFRAMYFESRFEEGELKFDYRLRQGVCTTPNATELMRSHGII